MSGITDDLLAGSRGYQDLKEIGHTLNLLEKA
jgi:hypothetical protein